MKLTPLTERLPSEWLPGIDRLSKRESDVVNLTLAAMPQHAIAAELGCSENAVRVAQHSAYKKLGVTNSAKLMALVIEALMPVDEV